MSLCLYVFMSLCLYVHMSLCLSVGQYRHLAVCEHDRKSLFSTLSQQSSSKIQQVLHEITNLQRCGCDKCTANADPGPGPRGSQALAIMDGEPPDSAVATVAYQEPVCDDDAKLARYRNLAQVLYVYMWCMSMSKSHVYV